MDLRDEFDKFAETCSNNNEQGESEMKLYMEILNEVYDEQFIEFSATTLNIPKKHSFESSLSKLEYLAHKGSKEYLGVLKYGIVTERMIILVTSFELFQKGWDYQISTHVRMLLLN